MTTALPPGALPTVTKAYRPEDRHLCRRPPSYTTCADCTRQLGLDHHDGYTRAIAGWATERAIDWPTGGIPADGDRITELARDDANVNRHPRAVYRMSHGGLAIGQTGNTSIPMDVIDPPDWDRGYRVIGEDGTWPTWWPTYSSAFYIAGLRQRIRALPKHGPHLIGTTSTSGNWDGYSVIAVNRKHFTRFGYAASRRNPNQPMFGHRVSFLVFYGYRPETVDHLCKEKLCCYPGHLGDATWNEQLAREHLGADYGYWMQRTEMRPQAAPKTTKKRRRKPPTPAQKPVVELQQGLAQLAAKYGPRTR